MEKAVLGRKTSKGKDVESEEDEDESEDADESGQSGSESDEDQIEESGEEGDQSQDFVADATQKISSSESQSDDEFVTQELNIDEEQQDSGTVPADVVASATAVSASTTVVAADSEVKVSNDSEEQMISETDRVVEQWINFQKILSENQDEENSFKRKFKHVLSSEDLDSKQEFAKNIRFLSKRQRTPRTPTLEKSSPPEKSSSSPKKIDKTFKFMKKKVRSPSMPSFSLGFLEDSEEPSQPDSPKLARVIKPSFYKKSSFTDEWHTLA